MNNGGQNGTNLRWINNNIPVYGARMLFLTKLKPNLKSICFGLIIFTLLIRNILFMVRLILMLAMISYNLNNMWL